MNKMIDNYTPYLHKGKQPIRVLEQNIIHILENESPDFNIIKRITQEKGLQKEIKYHISENPIFCEDENGLFQTPYIDMNKKIHLHETFLSFIWIISYSIFSTYREYDPRINYTTKKINLSNYIYSSTKLLEYGISLINTYTEWDYKLPNPEKFPTSDLKLKEYIEHTNGIFLYGVLFILFHEISHVDLKHIDYREEFYKRYRKQIPGNQIKIMEYEADNAAFGYFLKMLGSDGKKESIKLGCVIGMCFY